MSTAPHLHVAQPRSAGGPQPEMPSTPGFADALGERFLEFDLPTATAVERLHLRRDFSASPAFESALRDQIDRFEYFRHPAIAIARGVTRLPSGTLVLESRHVAGRRLSEVGLARNTALALEVIRQLTPALVALHEAGDVVHGLVGPDRIVVTRENRLVLTEHVLGSAIAAARVPASQLREEFGIALPPSPEPITVDHADDLTEVGLLALSLLVGRRIQPTEYPDRIERLVGESAMTAADLSPEAAWMRRWIERAVRVGPHPFQSAREAVETIGEMSDTGALRAAAVSRPARVASEPAAMPEPIAKPVVKPVTPDPPETMWPAFVETTPIAVATSSTVAVAPPPHVSHAPHTTRGASSAAEPNARNVAVKVSMSTHSSSRRWLMPLLALVAVGEAAVIAGLLVMRPPAVAALQASAPPPVASPLAAVPPAPDPKPAAPEPVTPAPSEVASHTAPPAADATLAAERFGGVKVTAPFDLQVFEGGKLLGVTAGPIALLAGSHTLDMVNDTFEFKSRTTAVVKPGQLTPLTVTAPAGKISVNAVPWADVEIDGKAAGQTPLANLSVAVGQHEIVFRHPQLGELRQTTIVKATTPTRISVTFPK